MKLYAVCWLYESQNKIPPLDMHRDDPHKIVYCRDGGLSVWNTLEEAQGVVERIMKDSPWVYEVVEVEV